MLKALLKHIEATSGSAAVLGWLSAIRMKRDDLEDETRRIPLEVLHGGLVAFVTVASKEAISDAAAYLVAPDNLGSWIRVLRGTTTPVEAFARIADAVITTIAPVVAMDGCSARLLDRVEAAVRAGGPLVPSPR